MRNQRNLLQRFLDIVICIGIHPDLPLVECRRVKLLNILALLCIPFFLVYPVVNIVQHRYFLASLNIINLASLFLFFAMHKYRFYLSARLIRIGFSITLFTLSGIFYQSGTEYCLVGTLVVTLMVFDNKWLVAGLSILISIVILSILMHPVILPDVEPVVEGRRYATMIISLFFIIVTIVFYKYIQSDYQQEIEKQQHALMAMNKDKEKLFSIVSHDIKSPLLILENMLDMYQTGLLQEKDMVEATGSLRKKVSQLNSTVETLLSWSLLGMNGIQTHPAHFQLLKLVNEVVQFSEFAVHQKNVIINVQVAEDVMIFADRDQLSIVLRNLFSNSLKFSYPGNQVDIFAMNVDGAIVISIKDYGVGIEESVMNKLFGSQQNPAYGTSGERGSGLGLLLCNEFINRNNGSIKVESCVGKGTCFSVHLPAQQSQLAALESVAI
ncbi:sensor histidine kinase [Niabella ginsengisoli]|uniref:histidine kinase n=1 Tax=Niabella ginsengisoli TaxID=522298 RepID=A0ABS9SI90_9BACT|nr:HAMP domain-containing sensor histidine kinase [Niabella ginsengisoli]MCH5598067.1 HAMP domain-containing histidine kinase [Niabella ginsengisoli]